MKKSKKDAEEREYTSLRVQGEGTKDGKPYAFISAQTSL